MNQQTQQNENTEKLSKSLIEKQLNRSISDEYYNLLLRESLINLLEMKENEENE